MLEPQKEVIQFNSWTQEVDSNNQIINCATDKDGKYKLFMRKSKKAEGYNLDVRLLSQTGMFVQEITLVEIIPKETEPRFVDTEGNVWRETIKNSEPRHHRFFYATKVVGQYRYLYKGNAYRKSGLLYVNKEAVKITDQLVSVESVNGRVLPGFPI